MVRGLIIKSLAPRKWCVLLVLCPDSPPGGSVSHTATTPVCHFSSLYLPPVVYLILLVLLLVFSALVAVGQALFQISLATNYTLTACEWHTSLPVCELSVLILLMMDIDRISSLVPKLFSPSVVSSLAICKNGRGAWEILCAVMSGKQRVDTREWCPIVVTHRLCVDQPRIYQTISCIVFAFCTFWSLVLGQDTRKKGLEILCRVPPPMYLPISASYHHAHNCWYIWQSCHTS